MLKSTGSMLPLDHVHACFTEDISAPAIGWFKEFPGEIFIVGKAEDEIYFGSFGKELSTSQRWNFGLHGAFVRNFEFRVDPQSFVKFDDLHPRAGALLVFEGKVMICLPRPSKRGDIRLEMGTIKGDWPADVVSAFTHWQILTRIDDDAVVLYDHDMGDRGL